MRLLVAVGVGFGVTAARAHSGAGFPKMLSQNHADTGGIPDVILTFFLISAATYYAAGFIK